jgi:hypothetical protein
MREEAERLDPVVVVVVGTVVVSSVEFLDGNDGEVKSMGDPVVVLRYIGGPVKPGGGGGRGRTLVNLCADGSERRPKDAAVGVQAIKDSPPGRGGDIIMGEFHTLFSN